MLTKEEILDLGGRVYFYDQVKNYGKWLHMENTEFTNNSVSCLENGVKKIYALEALYSSEFVAFVENKGTRIPEVKTHKGKIKSDGGSSDYYKIELPEWLLNKQKEQGFVMLEDLAEVIFSNDFNYTNIFKAQKRMFECEQGKGKEGNSFVYDAKKCKYYIDKQKEVYARCQMIS